MVGRGENTICGQNWGIPSLAGHLYQAEFPLIDHGNAWYSVKGTDVTDPSRQCEAKVKTTKSRDCSQTSPEFKAFTLATVEV